MHFCPSEVLQFKENFHQSILMISVMMVPYFCHFVHGWVVNYLQNAEFKVLLSGHCKLFRMSQALIGFRRTNSVISALLIDKF